MTPLTNEEVNDIILKWRDRIAPGMEDIRRSQDEVVLAVGAENMTYAITAMTCILAKGGIIVSNVNNTNIGNAGVAVTGGEVHGNITGTAQNNTSVLQKDSLEGLAKLKQALLDSNELNAEQKEDASSALSDLESEITKEEAEQSPGKVRNALKILLNVVSVAKGAEFLYRDVLPHLHTLFHLAS
jgi:hypothetical protein